MQVIEDGMQNKDGGMVRWGANDVIVVPAWMRCSHHRSKEPVLFSIPDNSAQEALGNLAET
jgi:gentisate 1,2-dioxygenase